MDQEPNQRDRGRPPARLWTVAAVLLCIVGVAAVLILSDWLGVERLGGPWDRAARGAGLVAVFLAAATVYSRGRRG